MRKYLPLFLLLPLIFLIYGASNKKSINRNVLKLPVDTIICGTPERDSVEFENLSYYDNNQYLEDLLDSLNYPPLPKINKSGVSPLNYANYPTRYWIPVKFWVIRN